MWGPPHRFSLLFPEDGRRQCLSVGVSALRLRRLCGDVRSGLQPVLSPVVCFVCLLLLGFTSYLYIWDDSLLSSTSFATAASQSCGLSSNPLDKALRRAVSNLSEGPSTGSFRPSASWGTQSHRHPGSLRLSSGCLTVRFLHVSLRSLLS